MFCSYCGTELPEGARFCGACGKPVLIAVEVPTETEVSAETEVPAENKVPAEVETPVEAEVPAEAEAPAEEPVEEESFSEPEPAEEIPEAAAAEHFTDPVPVVPKKEGPVRPEFEPTDFSGMEKEKEKAAPEPAPAEVPQPAQPTEIPARPASIPAQPYPQQPYAPAYVPAYSVPYAKPAVPGKGLAIASMVLGILGVVNATGFLSVGTFSFVFSLLALIFGCVARKKGYRQGMSTAGIVLGIIGLSLTVILIVLTIFHPYWLDDILNAIMGFSERYYEPYYEEELARFLKAIAAF